MVFLLGDGVEWCFWTLLPEGGMAPVCQDMEATASVVSLVQGKGSGDGVTHAACDTLSHGQGGAAGVE